MENSSSKKNQFKDKSDIIARSRAMLKVIRSMARENCTNDVINSNSSESKNVPKA